jgi:MATE family multidrug resistance protein
MVPALVAHAAKQFSEALNRAWVPNLILFAGVLLNVFFNWILIYGNLGSPALGLEGAGWATLLARLCMGLALVGYVLHSKDLLAYRPADWVRKLDWTHIKSLFRIGTPSGAQHLLEVGAFAFAGIMIGWIGAEALAAHQVAITCASTTFTLAMGLGMGVCIRIGQSWGARKQWRIRRTGAVGFIMVAIMMGAFGLIFALGRYPLARGFMSDPVVIAVTAQLFLVAALFQVVDGLQVMGLSALRGISDTRIPALIAILAYWVVALPVGYILAFRTPLGATGMWLGLALGLATAAICLGWRFHMKTHPRRME